MRIFPLVGTFCIALSLCGAGALRRAPGFCLPDQSLTWHDLQDYRGKVVLLDFMRTDCPHCQTLSGILEEAQRKYGQKIVVLSVVTPPDTDKTVAAYIREHKLSGPFLFDSSQVAGSYIRPTPQRPSVTLPRLYIIDGNGMISRDFEYRPDTEKIFAGRGLFTELDQILGSK
jgi:peroxiredoxin